MIGNSKKLTVLIFTLIGANIMTVVSQYTDLYPLWAVGIFVALSAVYILAQAYAEREGYITPELRGTLIEVRDILTETLIEVLSDRKIDESDSEEVKDVVDELLENLNDRIEQLPE